MKVMIVLPESNVVLPRSTEGMYFIKPGFSTMGRGFDMIVIHEDVDSNNDPRVKQWLNTSVRTMLYPGGQWIVARS